VTGAPPVDLDLHGFARLRLVDADPRDVATVLRQVGPLQAPSAGDADVTIRFVDRLPLHGPVRFVQQGEAGFTSDGFVVLRSRAGAPTRVHVPFEDIGSGLEIVCERGLPAVPLLLAILNLTVLGNGALPLHATAFELDGHGVLCTGWSKGGKTEALLAFLAHGARYVGDEWIYLPADGDAMFGVPEPVRLWHWQLQQVPDVAKRVPAGTRARLAALDQVTRGVRQAGAAQRTPAWAASVLRRAAPVLQRQLYVQLPPDQLVGGPHAMTGSAHPNTVFFMQSHDADEIVVEPVDPIDVAERMQFSLRYERLGLTALYEQFRFAFPDRRSALVDSAADLEQVLLHKVLQGKRAFAVRHPYPTRLAGLHDAMADVL